METEDGRGDGTLETDEGLGEGFVTEEGCGEGAAAAAATAEGVIGLILIPI